MEPVRIKVSIEVVKDNVYYSDQTPIGGVTMETRAQLNSVDHASGEMRRLVERTLEEVERQIGITKQVKALEEQKRVRVELGSTVESSGVDTDPDVHGH